MNDPRRVVQVEKSLTFSLEFIMKSSFSALQPVDLALPLFLPPPPGDGDASSFALPPPRSRLPPASSPLPPTPAVPSAPARK